MDIILTITALLIIGAAVVVGGSIVLFWIGEVQDFFKRGC